jgi:hypothetical protein
MTLLGKILAFVNLVIAMAMLSWSVGIYTMRPGWFDKAEGAYPTTSEAENFDQLKAEIDNLGRSAIAASNEWGTQRTRLEGLEKQRAARLKGYGERLEWARTGKPDNKDGAGFFEPVYDSRGLLDLNMVGDPILADDNRPLRGVNRLGANLAADVREVEKLSQQISKLRDEFRVVGTQILDTESRLLKMGVIRDSVQAELFHLATFEVNVYETRETVLRRKRQLAGRLAELGK